MAKQCSACGPLGLVPSVMRTEDIDFGDRRRGDYDDGGGLEADILEKGIMQSVLVLQRVDNRPLLLAGGRRFRIAEKHGLDVPVLISTKPLDLLEIRTIELAENIYRKDLSDAEKLALTLEIHELHVAKYGTRLPGQSATDKDGNKVGHTNADTAKILGVDPSTVTKDLKLARAIELLPELKQAKNKHEMQKTLDKILDLHDREQRAEVVRKQMGTGNPAKMQLANAFIVKDFFEGVRQLPEKSMNLVEVDPPYGKDLMSLIQGRPAYRGGKVTKYSGGDEGYQEIRSEDYKFFLKEVLSECYRVMTDDSWIIFWFAMEPWFETVYQEICNAGFTCNRVAAIWTKPQGACYNTDFLLASCYETFFYARKGKPKVCKPGRSNEFAYHGVPTGRRTHPTERPIELYEDVLSTFTMPGSKVLVPFAGSGATLLAAANQSMMPIGFDLSNDHKSAYLIRVHEGDIGHYKSLNSKPE